MIALKPYYQYLPGAFQWGQSGDKHHNSYQIFRWVAPALHLPGEDTHNILLIILDILLI